MSAGRRPARCRRSARECRPAPASRTAGTRACESSGARQMPSTPWATKSCTRLICISRSLSVIGPFQMMSTSASLSRPWSPGVHRPSRIRARWPWAPRRSPAFRAACRPRRRRFSCRSRRDPGQPMTIARARTNAAWSVRPKFCPNEIRPEREFYQSDRSWPSPGQCQRLRSRRTMPSHAERRLLQSAWAGPTTSCSAAAH